MLLGFMDNSPDAEGTEWTGLYFTIFLFRTRMAL